MCISYFNIWGCNSLLTRKGVLYSLPFINMRNINVTNKMDYIRRKKLLTYCESEKPILYWNMMIEIKDWENSHYIYLLKIKRERMRERERTIYFSSFISETDSGFFFKANRHSRLFPVILSSHHLKLVCFYFYSEKWRASVDSGYLDLQYPETYYQMSWGQYECHFLSKERKKLYLPMSGFSFLCSSFRTAVTIAVGKTREW